MSVLQKAIENGTLVQNLSTENNTSQNQQSNQKQCFCTGPEDIKYKLLENRLLILENHNQVMNTMYIQNQMQTALRESPSTGNIHVPQPVFGVQPTTMSYAPCMPPAYPQFFQRPMPMNHHIIQPVPNMHIPGIQPVQPTVIPVPISQQRVVYPTSMMPGQHVRPSGIPVPINHQHIYPTAPPSNLHTAMGNIRLNHQHTAAPTEQGVQQRLVPNRAESGARVDGDQIRAQQPSYPLPTSTCMATRQERKRLHEHSAAANIDGPSPTKISKVSDTIDLCTTRMGSSMINIQTTLERSSRSDQCTTPARLPSPQAKVLTLSHLDSPVIGHDQCTVAQNEETDDFFTDPRPEESTARYGKHRIGALRRDDSSLGVVTINIEGVVANRLFLEELCADNDIISLQEHWLWDFQKEWISQNFKNFDVLIRCHDSNEPISHFNIPRGQSGVAILYSNKLSDKITN